MPSPEHPTAAPPTHGQALPLRGACAGLAGVRHRAGARHERGDPGGEPGYDAVDGTADEGGAVGSTQLE